MSTDMPPCGALSFKTNPEFSLDQSLTESGLMKFLPKVDFQVLVGIRFSNITALSSPFKQELFFVFVCTSHWITLSSGPVGGSTTSSSGHSSQLQEEEGPHGAACQTQRVPPAKGKR